jgi:hypothetical protein
MNDRLNPIIGRRHVVRALTGAAVVAAIGVSPSAPAVSAEKSKPTPKARYQPNSAEAQTFYRVNRYPKS